MTKGEEYGLVGLAVVAIGALIYYLTRDSVMGAPTSGPGSVTATSSTVGGGMKLAAGGDPSLNAVASAQTSGDAIGGGSVPDLGKPDANGNSWVQGVDSQGNNLGAVEIDSGGNYLVSASKGPATESLKGRGHF